MAAVPEHTARQTAATDMPSSTMAIVGRSPSLMGCLLTCVDSSPNLPGWAVFAPRKPGGRFGYFLFFSARGREKGREPGGGGGGTNGGGVSRVAAGGRGDLGEQPMKRRPIHRKNVRNPNHHYFSKRIAIHLPFVLQYA